MILGLISSKKRYALSGLIICLLAFIPVSKAQLLSWEYEDIFTDIRMSAANPSLAVDAEQNIHVSFWNPDVDRLEYAYLDKTSGEWVFEIILPNKSAGYKSTTVIDEEGGIHVAFLENRSGVSYVGYATKMGEAWEVEEVLPDSSYGKYGLDLDFPLYIQPTISLQLTETGSPLILVFDGFYTSLSTCNHLGTNFQVYRRNYKMDLDPLFKNVEGEWEVLDFWDLPYINGSSCLSNGDRFGEYATLLPPIDGNMYAITPSVHNHRMYLWKSDTGDLGVWDSVIVEDVARYETVNATDFRESFDYLDAEVGNDGLVHMAYGVSDLYGFNVPEPSSPATSVNKRRYFYASFYPDSVGVPGYSPTYVDLLPVKDGIHRKHFAIATKGNDSIWIAHYHVRDRMVYMDQSIDGGTLWTKDTILAAQVGSPLELAQVGDSLFLLTHDGRNNQLLWSKKSLSDSTWLTTPVNQLEERANSFQSVVNRRENGDDIYAIYNEENSQNLLFSSRISGEWSEEILLENEQPAFIETGLNSQGEVVMAYLARAEEKLKLGFRENGVWEYQVIDTQSVVRDLSLQVIGDSLHICFYDLNEGDLKYARGTKETTSWSSIILDESSPIIGTGISMDQDVEGGLHVGYKDVAKNFLKYAYRSPAGEWTQQQVTKPNDFTISQTYIQVDSTGSPVIAGGDGPKTSIFLFEVSTDTFSIDTVLTAIPNFQGGPLSLLIDPKNRPWVLYNFSDVSPGLRLLRRGPEGDWNQVSVLNNQGQIANAFDFHLVDQDFYIIGKKNRLDGEGIGLLFATEGATTDLEESVEADGIRMFPNPATHEITLEWEEALSETTVIEIMDIQGQEVIQPMEVPVGTFSQKISLTSIPAGLYLIRIHTSNSFLTKKLLIKG